MKEKLKSWINLIIWTWHCFIDVLAVPKNLHFSYTMCPRFLAAADLLRVHYGTVGWGTKAQFFCPPYLKTWFFYVQFLMLNWMAPSEFYVSIGPLLTYWWHNGNIKFCWCHSIQHKLHRKIRFLNMADKSVRFVPHPTVKKVNILPLDLQQV